MDEEKILKAIQELTAKISTLTENTNQRLNVIESVVNTDQIVAHRTWANGIDAKLKTITKEIQEIVERVKENNQGSIDTDKELLAKIEHLAVTVRQLESDFDKKTTVNELRFGLNKENWGTVKAIIILFIGGVLTVIGRIIYNAISSGTGV